MRLTRPFAASCGGGFTYSLITGGNSLYVPLTSRCNSLTLPETRGPKFLLPPSVVAALCRVRDAEEGTLQWKHWCMWLETQEFPQQLPKALEMVKSLQAGSVENSVDGRRPTVSELLEEVKAVSADTKSIVVAGEGEPTLRIEALEQLVQGISQQLRDASTQAQTIRVITNGLMTSVDEFECTERLVACGVNSVSVALMTHDPSLYERLMQPCGAPKPSKDTDVEESHHLRVREFIRSAVHVGLQVETTAVDRPEVDKEETQKLATSLGVKGPVRWRPYFP